MASKDGVQKLETSRRFSSIDGIKAVRHGRGAGLPTHPLDFSKEARQRERVDFDDVMFDLGMSRFF